MKSIENLWKTRLQLYFHDLRRYTRYIFNDHLLFVLIFGLGAALYYYNGWIKTLHKDFPIGIVMGVILGLTLAISPIHTLLKEADKVFLISIETKMRSYFQKALRFSFSFQAYILILVLAACMPMYVKVTGEGFKRFFLLLLILFALKIWNLLLHWFVLKVQDQNTVLWDWLIRFVLNTVLLFFIIEGAKILYIMVILVIMVGLLAYFYHITKEKTVYWDLLIEREQRRMMSFYRFANLFADVPELKGRVKRRKWLDPVLAGIRFGKDSTYQYLFARTFLRTSQYFGLYMRLTIIGIILLIVSSQLYLSLILALLFIYLTGFQMIPMVAYHDLKIWIHLYPVSNVYKEKAFIKLLSICLYVQSVIFSLAVCIKGVNWEHGFIVFVSSIVLSLILIKWYVPSRIRK